MTRYNKPLPDIAAELTAPFWQGLRDRRIVSQVCDDCGVIRYPPAVLCPNCLSRRVSWTRLSTSGTLWSYVVYHRAFHPGFADELPYAVGLIDLPEGLRLAGRLVGPRDKISVGMPVTAAFDDVTEDVTLLRWTLDPVLSASSRASELDER